VSEHILELNTIGRFMKVSLDGGLAAVDGVELTTRIPPYYFDTGPASVHQVQMFGYIFDALGSAIPAAEECLTLLSSMQNRTGLVVCDSDLNLVKTRLYKLQNPVGDARWLTYSTTATKANLQDALASIQTIMAVFDYYNDPNVFARHRKVYRDVMGQLAKFEAAYTSQFGQNIHGQWQKRWYEFMNGHLLRVGTFTRNWSQNKLEDLHNTWSSALHRCNLVSASWCTYTSSAVNLIDAYQVAINTRLKMVFKEGVFTAPGS
jgi:hypothetical protein